MDEYMKRWVDASEDLGAQAGITLETLWDGSDDADAARFTDHFNQVYGRIATKLPDEVYQDIKAEVELFTLNELQKVAAVLVAACREFGVKDLTERVTLEREVEHPMNWCDGATGTEYYRRLAGWWRLCNEADDCGHVVYTRVQLGVRALHKHLLTLVDKHEEHQLNKAADTAGLYGGRATRASLERYVVIALQLCRVSREQNHTIFGAHFSRQFAKPPL